jgi:hypothetical protein
MMTILRMNKGRNKSGHLGSRYLSIETIPQSSGTKIPTLPAKETEAES